EPANFSGALKAPVCRALRRQVAVNVICFSQTALFRVDSQMGHPYIPAIAEAAARKRGDERSKPLRNKRNFVSQVFSFRSRPKNENGVLTGKTASNTTRPVDDAERKSLPLLTNY